MATVFRRKLTRYILNGQWVEIGSGKTKRRILRGKRVPKGTPGAKRYETLSDHWYGLVRGQYVKLCNIAAPGARDKSEKLLRKMLGEAEDLKLDRFAHHRRAPLPQHIEAFREHLKAKGRDGRYVKETIDRLKIVTAHCTRLEHVTADRVNACLNELARQGRGNLKKKKRGAAPTTRNSYLTAAKSFCQWCVRTRRLPDNPLAHLSKLNEQVDVRRERRTLTAAEIGTLIDTTDKSTEIVRELAGPDRAMLYLVAVNTGYRASELASLTSRSLLLEANPPMIVVEAEFSKRRREEAQPIPTWLADRLRTWLAKRPAQETLFVELDGQPLWPGSWRRHAAEMLREDLEAAGIEYRDAADGVFDFHSFRHQYISTLANSKPIPVAQRLARHSTSKLTDRYTHVALHDIVGAVESLLEPTTPAGTTLRSTGTDDLPVSGDARVTAQASETGQNWHERQDSAKEYLRKKKSANRLPLNELSKAEGMGLEPTTPCGAPHFQLYQQCT
jgi:site-specific recombinase XerD